MKGSHHFYHSKVKTCFSSPLLTTNMPINLHSITYHENNVRSPIRTYPIIALHGQCLIFHMLELYSTNQIPFRQIRLRSITCHFLINKLRLITYSNRVTQTHQKNILMEVNATDSEFFTHFSRVLTFSTNKVGV